MISQFDLAIMRLEASIEAASIIADFTKAFNDLESEQEPEPGMMGEEVDYGIGQGL